MSLFKRRLGILGGMGLRATNNFLQLLTAEINSRNIYEDSEFPTIIMLSIPLQEWSVLGSLNKPRVSAQVNEGLDWLHSAGADVIVVPCNTVHEFIEDKSVINIIDKTLDACKGTDRLGVLCSAQTRHSNLYSRKGHDIKYYHSQSQIDGLIDSVTQGKNPEIGPMINSEFFDCDKIILGCTELSMCTIGNGWNHKRNIIDSSVVLAKQAVNAIM